MLSVQSLDFGPSPRRILIRGLDFTLQPGQIAVVAGPSGVGKSTLLRVLTGEGFVGRGTAVFGEQDLIGGRAKVRIALVEQSFPLFDEASVLDNVLVARRPMFGAIDAAARTQAGETLRDLGLADLELGSSVRTLSGGEAQRVALARALVSDCPVMLLDEPFSNLDGRSKTQAIRLLRSHVGERGAVAVVVVHDDFDALRLGDVLVHLQAGAAPIVQELKGAVALDPRLLATGFASPGGLQQFTSEDGRTAEFVATDVQVSPVGDQTGGHLATVERAIDLPGGVLLTLKTLNGQIIWAFSPNSSRPAHSIKVLSKVMFTVNSQKRHPETMN